MSVTPNLVRHVIQNIIASPQFMNLLSSTVSPGNISNVTSEDSRNQGRSSFGTVDREISAMFRSRSQSLRRAESDMNEPTTSNAQFSYTGASNRRKRKRGRSLNSQSKSELESYPSFNLNVTLLPERTCNNVPRGGFKTSLNKHGFVLFAVQFFKEWDSKKLIDEMIKLFPGKLKENDEIELLRLSGSALVKPRITPGLSLTGDMVHRCWGKSTLYIRPKTSVAISDTNDTDAPDANDELPELISSYARNEYATSSFRTSALDSGATSTSEAIASEPLELDATSTSEIIAAEPLELDATSTSEIIAAEPLELGTTSTLETIITEPLEVGAINTMGSPEEATKSIDSEPLELKDIILELNSKISSLKMNDINVNRTNVLDGTLRAFRRKSFDPAAKINVVFTDNQRVPLMSVGHLENS